MSRWPIDDVTDQKVQNIEELMGNEYKDKIKKPISRQERRRALRQQLKHDRNRPNGTPIAE